MNTNGKREGNESTAYSVPPLATFKDAARLLGAASAAALRRRFERGAIPRRFIVQLTEHRPGVDVHGVLEWYRAGRPQSKDGAAADNGTATRQEATTQS